MNLLVALHMITTWLERRQQLPIFLVLTYIQAPHALLIHTIRTINTLTLTFTLLCFNSRWWKNTLMDERNLHD